MAKKASLKNRIGSRGMRMRRRRRVNARRAVVNELWSRSFQRIDNLIIRAKQVYAPVDGSAEKMEESLNAAYVETLEADEEYRREESERDAFSVPAMAMAGSLRFTEAVETINDAINGDSDLYRQYPEDAPDSIASLFAQRDKETADSQRPGFFQRIWNRFIGCPLSFF